MSHPRNSRRRPGAEGAGADSPPAPGRLSQAIFWTVWWVVLVGLWVLLVAKVNAPELTVGALAAGAGASMATAVRAQGLVFFRPRARWALELWRLAPRAALDVGILTIVLWRRLIEQRSVGGSFRAVPFRAVGEDPEEIARRVLAKSAGSFAPNTYVLDVDAERGLILFHQLSPDSDPKSPDPLRLG